MIKNITTRVWGILPAAGSGSRMACDIPKQYLTVAGKTVAEHTLRQMLGVSSIDCVMVALSPADAWWSTLPSALRDMVMVTEGGASRAQSVFNALAVLRDNAADNDWALVHDMARPCLTTANIEAMIAALADDPIGGVLATPVVDTLKRADQHGRVSETVSRDNLWRAQTPQMFRFRALYEALETGMAANREITDEASAIEQMGQRPRLIAGPADNIKITLPDDLLQAERILSIDTGAP